MSVQLTKSGKVVFAEMASRWLGVSVILASAFHNWPMEGRHLHELASFGNLILVTWAVITLLKCVPQKTSQFRWGWFLCPDASICLMVSVAVLSLAFSPSIDRSLFVVAKLGLFYGIGYSTFATAFRRRDDAEKMHLAAAIALLIAISACLLARTIRQDIFGFHYSVYKYGTYVGMLTPFACGGLLYDRRKILRVAGVCLYVLTAISVGSAGALLAVLFGLAVLVVCTNAERSRRVAYLVLLLSTGALALSLCRVTTLGAPLKADCSLSEAKSMDLRQRYLEWQAEMSLAEHRSLVGTGVGCLSFFRSGFYGALPKLNTLQPYDQNGWLMTATELGLPGLTAFAWMLARHIGYVSVTARESWRSASVVAGLAGAGIAHVFSSVEFNGNLLIFVMLLAAAATYRRVECAELTR